MFCFHLSKIGFWDAEAFEIADSKDFALHLCYFSLRTFLLTVGVPTFKKITVLSEIISRVSSHGLVNL